MTERARPSFSHVGIYVSDMSAMEAFYTGPLAMTVTDRGGLSGAELVFLSTTPEEHHELVLVEGRPDGVLFNVVNQISFRVPTLGALKRIHAALAAYPAGDIQPVTHGNAWSVYCRDPEGNRVELFADSPWHVEQPVREPFDILAAENDIVADTEALCRSLPGFGAREDWQADLARKMRAKTI